MAVHIAELASVESGLDWSGICRWSEQALRSRKLLLQGLFGAEWALCGSGAVIALEPVSAG